MCPGVVTAGVAGRLRRAVTRVTGYTGHVTRCLATAAPPRVQQESVAGTLQQNSAGICAPSDEIVTNYNFYYVPSFCTHSHRLQDISRLHSAANSN